MSNDVPGHRVLPYLRRRKRAKSAQRAKKDPHLQFKRTTAQISPIQGLGSANSVNPATVLLGDISFHGVKVFAEKALYPGQKISVAIEYPRMLFMRGRVVHCREISRDQKIISLFPVRYRILIAFDFKSVEERIALKRYLGQIAEFNRSAEVVL